MVAKRAEPASRRPARLRNEIGALARSVRTIRRQAGWTLEQAAERMRIDLKHLQRIEAGEANVTFATLLRMADALDTVFEIPATRPPEARGTMPLRENALPFSVVEPTASVPASASGSLYDPDALVRRVGRRIAELRAAGGMTQRQLAERTGISLGLVQRIESGRQRGVSLRSLARFGGTLGVGVEELLSTPAGPPPRRGRPSKRDTG